MISFSHIHLGMENLVKTSAIFATGTESMNPVGNHDIFATEDHSWSSAKYLLKLGSKQDMIHVETNAEHIQIPEKQAIVPSVRYIRVREKGNASESPKVASMKDW